MSDPSVPVTQVMHVYHLLKAADAEVESMNIHHKCCAQHLQILVDKQYCVYYTQSGSAGAGLRLPCNTPIKTAVR